MINLQMIEILTFLTDGIWKSRSR